MSRPDPGALWDQALAYYHAAKAAAEAITVNDLLTDRAGDAEGIAQDYLIEHVPAPHGRALAIKIVFASERADAFDEPLFEDHAKAIFADARRLAGVA